MFLVLTFIFFRGRWSFWSGQEERSSADNGPSPAAGQRISADSRGCRPAGQPQHSRCALCSGWIPTSTVQQCLLHHLCTWEHPRGTAVSIQNTEIKSVQIHMWAYLHSATSTRVHGCAEINSLLMCANIFCSYVSIFLTSSIKYVTFSQWFWNFRNFFKFYCSCIKQNTSNAFNLTFLEKIRTSVNVSIFT